MKAGDKVLNFLKQLLRLIKPKFHNWITNSIVIFGLTLIAESQLNFIDVFVLFIVRELLGPDVDVSSFLSYESQPYIGIALVIIGLLYNLLVLFLFDKEASARDQAKDMPSFDMKYLSIDGEIFDDVIAARGSICIVKNYQIPDNHFRNEEEETLDERSKRGMLPGEVRFSPISSSLLSGINKNFYRDRKSLIETWCGAEVFNLCIENVGNVVARNVRVEVLMDIPSGSGLSVDQDLFPEFPAREKDILSSINRPVITRNNDDISVVKNGSQCKLIWDVGDLQAKCSRQSDSEIFLRVTEIIQIEIKIYSDELSSPYEMGVKVIPAKTIEYPSLDQLVANGKDFANFFNDRFMDGFFLRRIIERVEESESHGGNVP